MSPAEAAEFLEEPNWVELWNVLKVADDGFNALMLQWRRWHWTPVEVSGERMKQPAGRVDAILGLARLGIMPPQNVKRALGLFQEQHDDHCWLVSKDRAWRILGILDGWLIVNSFGEEWHVDMLKAKWDNYVAGHAAALQKEGPPTMPLVEGP